MTRARTLPAGWYPSTAAGIRSACDRFLASGESVTADCCSVIAPHAGWAFSGPLACRAIARLGPVVRTVVVVGGHLRRDDPVLIAGEDAIETPLGDLEVDAELAQEIRDQLGAVRDTHADNTVEVHLPFIASLHDMPKVVYARCPPSGAASELGRVLCEYARDNPGIVVVGSTDLTHYGPAYGLTDHGTGRVAVEWVKHENDERFIGALLRQDPAEIVGTANKDHSACSPGAAAAAAGFSALLGCHSAELLGYYTSYDVSPNDSFVGYAGVGYRRSE